MRLSPKITSERGGGDDDPARRSRIYSQILGQCFRVCEGSVDPTLPSECQQIIFSPMFPTMNELVAHVSTFIFSLG